MVRHLSARDIDWTLLVIALLICAVGILQIYSVTRGSDSSSAWWKQILYVLGGLVLMWLVLPSERGAAGGGNPMGRPATSAPGPPVSTSPETPAHPCVNPSDSGLPTRLSRALRIPIPASEFRKRGGSSASSRTRPGPKGRFPATLPPRSGT